jgi:hypothetical protein
MTGTSAVSTLQADPATLPGAMADAKTTAGIASIADRMAASAAGASSASKQAGAAHPHPRHHTSTLSSGDASSSVPEASGMASTVPHAVKDLQASATASSSSTGSTTGTDTAAAVQSDLATMLATMKNGESGTNPTLMAGASPDNTAAAAAIAASDSGSTGQRHLAHELLRAFMQAFNAYSYSQESSTDQAAAGVLA